MRTRTRTLWVSPSSDSDSTSVDLTRTRTPPRWTWTQAGGLRLWSHGLELGLHPGGPRLTVNPGESGEKYTNTRHIFKLLCAIMDKTEE